MSSQGLLSRLIQRYSIAGQQRRIELSEHLFRSAQRQATDRKWHTDCHVDVAFRPRHSLLTLHIWLLHRRLLLAIKPSDSAAQDSKGTAKSFSAPRPSLDTSTAQLLQEELFETFWHDTKARIRAEGIQELMVAKSLKDVQNYTFQNCMALDHAIDNNHEQLENSRTKEDVGLVLWTHVYGSNEQIQDEVVDSLADYVVRQYQNVVYQLPEQYLTEGRVGWIDCPAQAIRSLAGPADSAAVVARLGQELPKAWFTNLTDSGDLYYWNEETMDSSWERPS